MQLPASAILSEGLEKRGNIAVASGGLTDIWKGDLDKTRVAIKAFRRYRDSQDLREAKKVRMYVNLGPTLTDGIHRFCGDGYPHGRSCLTPTS